MFDLIYNSTFTLLDKNDSFSVFFSNKLNNWHLAASFFDDKIKSALSTNLSTENNIISLIHYNWYSDDWAEYSSPFMVQSANKKITIYIKLRSKANRSQPFRTVEITIWKLLPKI
jgi:hypothetical protein